MAKTARGGSEDARFTDLVCALSSRLASASGDRILDAVGAALEDIRVHFGADQCVFLRFFPERRAVVVVQRAAGEGVPPIPADVDYGRAFPLTYRTAVERLEPFVLDRLEDLPAEEVVQRESSLAMGLGAYIALPIVISGAARYSLSMGCNGRPKRWPRGRIRQMQALGETIAGALERWEDEGRVRRSESELAQAQRISRTGSWVRDFVADHLSASEEAWRIIGARPLSGAQWDSCIHPEDRARVSREREDVLRERRATYLTEYRISQDGAEPRLVVEEGEIRYHADGHPMRAIGTLRDVTESRRIERELQDLRSRIWHADRAARAGALGSSLSHELGQPLSAILANAQAGLRFIADGKAGAQELREILEAVVREDKRAVAIIDGLRSLLRKEQVRREPIDLAATLAETAALLKGEFAGLGVAFEARLPPGIGVLASKAQVQQVALNLLSNALEAVRERPPGGRRIELRLARRDGEVDVTVSDSGRGIAEDARPSLFEPFRSTRSGGLGLGLAISRSIVEAHGGRIRVEGNARGGASFVFSLPFHDAAPPAVDETAGPPDSATSEPGTRGTREDAPLVCLVDDDDAVRESIARLLVSSGYSVAAFRSGSELLATDEAARADCALLDVRMAEMSGPDLQAALAKRFPLLPVVFLTGHGDLPTGIRAMRTGAVDFLLKPVEDVVLLATVARALKAGARLRAREDARHEALERLARLSPREREIMDHVVRGRLNKQIAADLGISEATVKQHRGRVMEKVGADSVAALVRLGEAAASGPSYQGRISGDDPTP